MQRKYYEAYDDRYRQMHEQDLQWFHSEPSVIVMDTINTFAISEQSKLLEIGCGEGRDAYPLLKKGFNLLATDVSPEAIRFCQKMLPELSNHFQIVDCVSGNLNYTFDLIYAVAVIHMLVPDEDRDAFFTFIRKHLTPTGIALICTMGDGSIERQSDINSAFDIQDSIHEQTGKAVKIARTSCRMVSFETFNHELDRNGLAIIQEGITSAEPDFTQMMYAIVKAK